MNEVAEFIFITGGVIVVALLLLRSRRVSRREQSATATAAFGLFLCGRHAGLVQGDANWIFTIAVGAMMFLLAFSNLGFGTEQRTAAR